jgi:hypothetical protein
MLRMLAELVLIGAVVPGTIVGLLHERCFQNGTWLRDPDERSAEQPLSYGVEFALRGRRLNYAARLATLVMIAVLVGLACSLVPTDTRAQIVVNPTSTSTTLASSATPAFGGTSVTFSATVTGSNGTPTGIVTFNIVSCSATFCSTGQLGTANLSGGVAMLSTSALTGSLYNQSATWTLEAIYNGDGNNSPSASTFFTQTMQPAPTVTTLTSSQNPGISGQPLTLTASVTGGSATFHGGVPVTFYDGNTQIGVANVNSSGVASITATFSAGTHNLTAAFSNVDLNHQSSTSTIITQPITGIQPTITTLASSLNPSSYQQAVTLTATVTSSNGVPTSATAAPQSLPQHSLAI